MAKAAAGEEAEAAAIAVEGRTGAAVEVGDYERHIGIVMGVGNQQKIPEVEGDGCKSGVVEVGGCMVDCEEGSDSEEEAPASEEVLAFAEEVPGLATAEEVLAFVGEVFAFAGAPASGEEEEVHASVGEEVLVVASLEADMDASEEMEEAMAPENDFVVAPERAEDGIAAVVHGAVTATGARTCTAVVLASGTAVVVQTCIAAEADHLVAAERWRTRNGHHGESMEVVDVQRG